MFTVAQLSRSARLLATICTPLALAGVLAPTAASAQIEETSDILNKYGTTFSGAATAGGQNESKVTIYSGTYGDSESELGLNYTATVDEDTGGFFFLHDNYCVGTCSTASETTITFTVTNRNDGGDNQDIWFHSQITPGHLAQIFDVGPTGGLAGFNFTVSRLGFREPLYSASGSVNSDGIFLDTGGLNYNGLGDVVTGNNYKLLDWQATDLSINAGSLLFNETMQIQYKATYWSSNEASCADVLVLCSGAQVVFGDPRNNGGVNVSSLSAFAALGEPEPADPLAVIGADYGAFLVPFEFSFDPTPGFDPPVLGDDLVYGQLYRSRTAIPEPESWALMILGFGAAGTAMRRQRSRLRTANA